MRWPSAFDPREMREYIEPRVVRLLNRRYRGGCEFPAWSSGRLRFQCLLPRRDAQTRGIWSVRVCRRVRARAHEDWSPWFSSSFSLVAILSGRDLVNRHVVIVRGCSVFVVFWGVSWGGRHFASSRDFSENIFFHRIAVSFALPIHARATSVTLSKKIVLFVFFLHVCMYVTYSASSDVTRRLREITI